MVPTNTGEALRGRPGSAREKAEALRAEAKALKEVARALVDLGRMDMAALRLQHEALFGEPARSKNAVFLRRKLAFRIQERVEGGLPPWAEARIWELAPKGIPGPQERRAKVKSIKAVAPAALPPRDERLPAPGGVLLREYRGARHEVEVLEAGFTYRGRTYASLSTIAKEITGTPWNGFLFFGLQTRKVTHGA